MNEQLLKVFFLYTSVNNNSKIMGLEKIAEGYKTSETMQKKGCFFFQATQIKHFTLVGILNCI
jgi:hypothetical protein